MKRPHKLGSSLFSDGSLAEKVEREMDIVLAQLKGFQEAEKVVSKLRVKAHSEHNHIAWELLRRITRRVEGAQMDLAKEFFGEELFGELEKREVAA